MAEVGGMALLDVDGLEIPPAIFTLEGFRAWYAALGSDAPRASFVGGYVFVEMSPQNYHTHGPVVTAIHSVLTSLAIEQELGMYHTPPSWFTHVEHGLSTEPDGFFTSYAALEAGRVGINAERPIEMVGTPDMVLEVVSRTSRRKDEGELRRVYAAAGVSEYWLVDALGASLSVQILQLTGDGSYRAAADDGDGWIPSRVWGRAFRLRGLVNRVGLAEYRLDVRPLGSPGG